MLCGRGEGVWMGSRGPRVQPRQLLAPLPAGVGHPPSLPPQSAVLVPRPQQPVSEGGQGSSQLSAVASKATATGHRLARATASPPPPALPIPYSGPTIQGLGRGSQPGPWIQSRQCLHQGPPPWAPCPLCPGLRASRLVAFVLSIPSAWTSAPLTCAWSAPVNP